MFTNSTVLTVDRYGVCLINLQTKEVVQIQNFEDQAKNCHTNFNKMGKNDKVATTEDK